MTGVSFFFFFQAEDGIRDGTVTGVQTCALPIFASESVGMRRCTALCSCSALGCSREEASTAKIASRWCVTERPCARQYSANFPTSSLSFFTRDPGPENAAPPPAARSGGGTGGDQ